MRKVCKVNKADVKQVQQCMGGLTYHTEAVPPDANIPRPTLVEKDWAPNELLALGAIFKYHKIEFLYVNKYGHSRRPYIFGGKKLDEIMFKMF